MALLCVLLLSTGAVPPVGEPRGSGGETLSTKYDHDSSGVQKQMQQPQKKQQMQQQQHHQQQHSQRQLEEMRHDGSCHADILTSPLPESNASYSYTLGLVFSVINNSPQSIAISGLGLYLDANSGLQFDYDLYSMDGPYLTTAANGSYASTTIGGALDGTGDWQPVASGVNTTVDDFTTDADGASFLSFGGNSVTVGVGDITSLYVKFTENLLVEEGGLGDAETLDGSVIVSGDYTGVGTLVGRKDIFGDEWVDVGFGSAFNVFFPPARFVGKLWTGQSSCSPTPAPSKSPTLAPVGATDPPTEAPSREPTYAPSKSPTPKPTSIVTIIVTGNEFVLDFSTRRRLRSSALVRGIGSSPAINIFRALQSNCLNPPQLAFAEERLEAHANSVYQQSLSGSTTVTNIDITVTGHVDISVAQDCSKIKFIYDQEMQYQTDGTDDTTVAELVQLPLSSADNRQAFVDDLVSESGNSPNAGVFADVKGAEEITVTMAGLSTRSPTSSPSVSASPSSSPSASPTGSPSETPSTSTRPSMSASPSLAYSVAPSTSSSPTSTKAPSPAPSAAPSASAAPTENPSSPPSLQPTSSSAPSFSPSGAPSESPSLSPSTVPSSMPSTTLNYLDLSYQFDISYPPEQKDEVWGDLESNVTGAFTTTFSGPLLNPLRVSNGLAYSERPEDTPFVNEIGGDDIECEDGPEENCHRLALTMFFQHERSIQGGIARNWLLEVSDTIAASVTATYTGDESVQTNQTMTLPNIENEPENPDDICPVVLEMLEEAEKLKDYRINACRILDTVLIRADGDAQGKTRKIFNLRRRLNLGDLVVVFEVYAEYTPALRDEKQEDAHFAKLVEDSINRDVGKDISKTLTEREIVAVQGDVTTKTVTQAPTPAPISVKSPAPPPSVTEEDNFATGTTGIAIIVTCSIVAVLVAGFFLYKGLHSTKVDDENLWDDWESYDMSSTDNSGKKAKRSMTELLPDDVIDGGVEVLQDESRAHTSARERTVSGQSNTPKDNRWVDEKLDMHEGITRSQNDVGRSRDRSDAGQDRSMQRENSRNRLDAFEARIRQKSDEPDGANISAKSESQRKINDFDARLQRKLNGRKASRQDSGAPQGTTHNDSMSTLESFEERVLRKSAGKPTTENRSSMQQLEEFDDRLQRKLEGGQGGQRGRSPARSAQEAFDERVRRKVSAEDGSNYVQSGQSQASASSFDDRLKKKLSRGRSRGNSVDSQDSRSSFDERLKKKLSRGRSRGNSVDSQESRSSFDDRLKRKLRSSQSSTDRSADPSQNLKSTPSSRHLDDFEARILAKSRGDEKARAGTPSNESYSRRLTGESYRSASSFDDRLREKLANNNTEGERLNRTQSSDDYEARIAAKSKGGDRARPQSSSYEDRLQQKLNGNGSDKALRSSSGPTSSSRHLDDFEARIAAKNKEGNASKSLRSSSGPTSSFRNLDDFEARIAAKSKEGNASKSLRSSSGPTSSSRNLDDFEARIAAKSKEGNSSKSLRSSSGPTSSSRNLDDFEARIAAKSKAGNGNKKGNSSKSLRSSYGRTPSSRHLDDFEARIAAKNKEGNASKSLRSSYGPTPSSRNLDEFEARIAAKSKEGNASKSLRSSHGSSSSSRHLDDFEARIAAKNKKGNASGAIDSIPGAHSSSSKHLDDFERRIAAKSKDGNASKGGGESRPLSQSVGAHSSSSSALDNFNARIQAKSRESAVDRSRSQSPGANDRQSTNARFKEAFQKARALNTIKDIGHSDARSRARVDYNEQLSKTLQGGSAEGSQSLQEFRRKNSETGVSSPGIKKERPSVGATPSQRNLDAFEARIAAKNKQAEGNRPRERSQSPGAVSSSSSSQVLDDLEARIVAKGKQGDPGRVRGTSLSSAPSYEDRLRKKLSSSGSEKSSSSRRLDDFERRIAAKNAQSDRATSKSGRATPRKDSKEAGIKGSQNSAASSLSSFDSKLQRKLERNAAAKKRTPSQRQLDDFQDRVKKKTEGASQSRSSQSSLSSFEAKLEQKLAAGGKKKESEQVSSSVSSFEARLAKKLQAKSEK